VNIRSQLLLAGCLVLVFQIGILYSFYITQIHPDVVRLEKSLVEKNLHRNIEYLQRELYSLERIAKMMIELPMVQQAIHSPQLTQPLDETLERKMIQQEINAMFILDNNEKVLWERILDLNSESPYLNQNFLSSLWQDHPTFFKHSSSLSLQAGIYNSSLGPTLIVSAPIVDSTHHTILGTFIVAKIITQEFLQLIYSLSFTEMKLWPLSGAALGKKHLDILNQIQLGDSDYLIEKAGGAYRGYMSLRDLNDKATLLISTSHSREVTSLYQHSIAKTILVFFTIQIFFILALLYTVKRSVLSPLSRLTQELQQAKENWRPTLIPYRTWNEIMALQHALSQYINRQTANAHQAARMSYQEGSLQVKAQLLQSLNFIVRPVLEGLQWLEKQVSTLPTNEVEWLRANSLHRPEHTLELPQNLENIHEQLRTYQKDTRKKLYALQKQTLRNLANIKIQFNDKEALQQFLDQKPKSEKLGNNITRS